jgi:hypothetical protein
MSFPGSGPDTPDAWIERNPYDEEHDPEAYEVCPVCDRIACSCEPEADDLSDLKAAMDPQTLSHFINLTK